MIEVPSLAIILTTLLKWIFSGFAAGFILFVINYRIQKSENKQNLDNILILIVDELCCNYLLLGMMEMKLKPMRVFFHTKSWDDSKSEIARQSNDDLIILLSSTYQYLHLENSLDKPLRAEYIKSYKNLIHSSLMKIRKVSKFQDYIDLMYNITKENVANYNNPNNTTED